MRRAFLLSAAILGATGLTPAGAQWRPDEPVTIIVPWANSPEDYGIERPVGG